MLATSYVVGIVNLVFAIPAKSCLGDQSVNIMQGQVVVSNIHLYDTDYNLRNNLITLKLVCMSLRRDLKLWPYGKLDL